MNIGKYRASLVGVIAQALKGYIGHQAIISELLQNADDAGSSVVSFHFKHNRLEVRNNSYFTEKDWQTIIEVASGGKHDEEGKIGTFGTGFISVYHITDQPEIFSDGVHITLNPLNDDPNPREDPIGKNTIFHFPWRSEESELSRRIESRIWDKERIQEFLEVAQQFIPEAFLFLRYVRQIDVFEEEHLVVSIKRTKSDEKVALNHIYEVWQIEQNSQSQTWIYYHIQNQRATPGNLKIKDRQVSLAFPLGSHPVTGKVYNFLPTQMETGYAFHINGAFFPDNNRRGVLDDIETNPERTQWNHSVIDTISELFASVLIDIRDQFTNFGYSANDFYQLWPLRKTMERYNLATVRERFIKQAKISEVVYTSLGHWEFPARVWVAESVNLHNLASEHLNLLPNEAVMLKTFIRQYLGADTLTLRNMLIQIKDHLRSHILLAQAHPLINTRERLRALYEELPKKDQSDFNWVREQPIFLSEVGTLTSVSQIWRADQTIRDLFHKTDRPLFVDDEFQAQLSDGYIASFRGTDLVNWLWKWEQEHPDNTYIVNVSHLKRILTFISDDLSRIDRKKLSQIHIVLIEGVDKLYSSQRNIFFAKGMLDYELGILNLLFVERNLAQDAKLKRIYEAAGIQSLQANDVIYLLEADASNLLSIEMVQKLYRYFGREELSAQNVERLRHLPIYLTGEGYWVSLSGHHDLSLKPQVQFRAWSEVSGVLDKLQLDNFIHHDLENLTSFLHKIGIKQLDELTFNRRLVEQYYASTLLDDSDRYTLLEYLRINVFDSHSELFPVMKNTALLLCNDGHYRRVGDTYFAAPFLDEILGNAYPQPHSGYGLEVASSGDENQTLYHQNKWYPFLSQLGMLEEPYPNDVINRIRQLVATRPNNSSIEAIKRIAEYLNGLTEEKLLAYSQLSSLVWLPAHGDDKEWHLPSTIYEKKYEKLIGKQAPFLRFEVKPNLRKTLGLPGDPSGELVARHLLTCMKTEALAEDGSIYRYLGKHWNEIKPQTKQHIKDDASIWDRENKRYWKPIDCFIGEQEQPYFGVFRHYRAEDGSDIEQFYQLVGIQKQATNAQRLAFLREIAADLQLPEDKRPLLIANLRLIGREIEFYREIVAGCQSIRIVPDENGNLHRADKIVLDDQPGLREKFSGIDLHFIPKDFYEESIVKFWDSIGVIRLSTAQPRIVEIKGQQHDDNLKQRIVDRIQFLRRVIYDKRGSSEIAYDLKQLNVFVCNQLRTSYQILQIISSSEAEEVAFDREKNSLFHIKGADNILLARKLMDILHLHNVIDAPTIEAILNRELAEIDSYLDKAGYKSLPQETLEAIISARIPLAKTNEANIQSFEDENSQPTQQEQVDELNIYYGEASYDVSQEEQISEFVFVSSSSLHAHHYPNNPSELTNYFGVEQEFPEIPPIEFRIDFDEESFEFDKALEIDEGSFPTNWDEAFADEPENTRSNLYIFFNQSSPREVFRDIWNIQRELPKPEHRRGLFDTICLVFGTDQAEMHISVIRSAVWKRRPDIVQSSIGSILSRASPCFERLGNGYWKFHAKYIEAGYRNLNSAISISSRWVYVAFDPDHSMKLQPTSSNNKVSASHSQSRQKNNLDTPISKAEGTILAEETHISLSNGLLVDLETFLEHIPFDTQERQHDIIRRTAHYTEQEQQYELSLVLYEMLHKRGITGFEKKIKALQHRVPLTEIARQVSVMSQEDPRRWTLWIEALDHFTESLILRDMIRRDILDAASHYHTIVEQNIHLAVEETAQKYINWLELIHPLRQIWHQDQVTILRNTVPLVFDWLMEKEIVDLALALVAKCPLDSLLLHKFIDMNKYIHAIDVVANWLAKHEHERLSVILRAYGLRIAKSTAQKLIDIDVFEKKARSVHFSSDDLVLINSDKQFQNWINRQILEQMIQ